MATPSIQSDEQRIEQVFRKMRANQAAVKRTTLLARDPGYGPPLLPD